VPFCYYEAAINRVTNDKFDPVAKIPELKYCAIRITAGGAPPQQVSFGGGQALERVMEAIALRS
jgi:formate dehydrogenase major subunit